MGPAWTRRGMIVQRKNRDEEDVSKLYSLLGAIAMGDLARPTDRDDRGQAVIGVSSEWVKDLLRA